MGEHVAIVGGGIAGASVAFHLSQRTDVPITVYERNTVGAATTARSTAVFRMMGDPVLDEMKRYAMGLYNDFFAAPEATPEYELIGRLELSSEPDHPSLRERKPPTGAYVSGDELSETALVPELASNAVAGALYSPNAGIFRPVELTHEFVERARNNGVEFRSNTEITDIETDANGVTAVQTDANRFPADHVVCAAGPWNLEVGRSAGLEFPLRHTLAPIARLEPTRPLGHTLPNIKHVDSGYYFVGQGDGSVLVGHSPGSFQDAGTEYVPDSVSRSIPDEVRSGMIDVIERLLPPLLDADIVEEWVGIRSLTPDGRPIVGPTGVDGLSVVGFNSEGIQLAPAAGRIIAAQILGDEPPAYATDVLATRFDDDEVGGVIDG